MAYVYDWCLVYVQRCGGIDAEEAYLDDDSDDGIPQSAAIARLSHSLW